MPNDLFRLFPVEGTKILLVLFLSFLIGLEREERKSNPNAIPSEASALFL